MREGHGYREGGAIYRERVARGTHWDLAVFVVPFPLVCLTQLGLCVWVYRKHPAVIFVVFHASEVHGLVREHAVYLLPAATEA